ncbi:kinase-like domain-containing protein [Lactarius hatsudake]|nr:kinase-like domain-containing protein [Lactarius hatsudake]
MPSYPASASQFLGQTIDNGALRIDAILGAGAFGVVYRAIDIETGAQYAIKRVEKEGNEYYQTRERQLHSRVSSHPHVLTFHREIHEGRYAFYVYDLCAGDLHEVIKKVMFSCEDELIKRVFIQIIDALEYCHKRGVYHRDLKPENILVSALGGDMDVFIADFGLATTSKMTASACGTPCFMSPESLVPHHNPYSSAQGDVWALGCILAEMIGNVRPWSLATPEDSDYSYYLMNRTVLFDKLPVSHSAYLLLRKIFSTKPELRPSLAAIRTEVLAMDTFFLTSSEAGNCGWGDRMEKQKLRKLRARGVVSPPSRHSSADTSSSGSYRFETCSLGSSSGSRYSCGSSSSAFDSSSGESIELPATPPAPVAEVIRTMDKASRSVLVQRVVAAHWQTC